MMTASSDVPSPDSVYEIVTGQNAVLVQFAEPGVHNQAFRILPDADTLEEAVRGEERWWVMAPTGIWPVIHVAQISPPQDKRTAPKFRSFQPDHSFGFEECWHIHDPEREMEGRRARVDEVKHLSSTAIPSLSYLDEQIQSGWTPLAEYERFKRHWDGPMNTGRAPYLPYLDQQGSHIEFVSRIRLADKDLAQMMVDANEDKPARDGVKVDMWLDEDDGEHVILAERRSVREMQLAGWPDVIAGIAGDLGGELLSIHRTDGQPMPWPGSDA